MQTGWLKLGMVTTLIGVAAALPSCGGDDDDDDRPTGGSGGGSSGAGTSGAGRGGTATTGGSGGATGGAPSESVPCGAVVCTATGTAALMVPACCFDAPSGRCGLDTSLLAGFGVAPARPCEPLAQPGEPDQSCPNSEPLMVGGTNLPAFQGCCREETGQCGFLIDKVGGLVPIGLGCVDSAPFLDGGAAPACGSGGSGG